MTVLHNTLRWFINLKVNFLHINEIPLHGICRITIYPISFWMKFQGWAKFTPCNDFGYFEPYKKEKKKLSMHILFMKSYWPLHNRIFCTLSSILSCVTMVFYICINLEKGNTTYFWQEHICTIDPFYHY